MNLLEPQYENLITPYDPRALGGAVDWICMDERFALLRNLGLYRQIAAAGHGVGQDIFAATELERKGTYLNTTANGQYEDESANPSNDVSSIPVLGKVAAASLRMHSVKLHVHEACAAEGQAQGIALAIADSNNHEGLFTLGREFYSGLTRDKVSDIQLIFGAIASQKKLASRDTNDDIFTRSTEHHGLFLPALQRVPLAPIDHVADRVVVNHRKGVAFDTFRALEQQQASYHISLGDMLEEIHGPLHDLFPIREENFLSVTAVRHAAVILHALPRPTGKPLEVRHAIEFPLAA
jgi:hypothetical protein